MRTVKIVDIAEQIRGVSYNPEDVFDTAQENTVPLLRANNIQDTGLNYDDLVYVQKSKVSPKQLLRQGDILVCASSGSRHLVGKAGHVYNDFGTFGAFCKVLRPNAQLVNSNYFAHYFQSPLYRRTIANLAAGANINNIKNEHLNELQIKLPCLQEQNTIARVLDKTNAIIGKRRAQLSCLNELAKSRFIEMFGDPVTNPRNFVSIPLNQMANIASGITKGRKTKDLDLKEVPYMAVSNVKDGYIDWTTVKTILATHAEIQQYRILPDDVLMTEGGDPDKLGRGALIRTPLKDCIHQNHIFRVRLDKKMVLPVYFAEYLKKQKAKRYFLGCAKQTTGIASINMTQLRVLPVLLPPITLQNEFASFIEELDKSKFTIRKSLEQLETLYRALLQEYFG